MKRENKVTPNKKILECDLNTREKPAKSLINSSKENKLEKKIILPKISIEEKIIEKPSELKIREIPASIPEVSIITNPIQTPQAHVKKYENRRESFSEPFVEKPIENPYQTRKGYANAQENSRVYSVEERSRMMANQLASNKPTQKVEDANFFRKENEQKIQSPDDYKINLKPSEKKTRRYPWEVQA